MNALRELRLRRSPFRRLAAALDAARAGSSPPLDSMPTVTTADEAYERLGVADAPRFAEEFGDVERALSERYAVVELADPPAGAVAGAASELLYCLVRSLEPDSVVETGIGDGHSSFVVLTALERNGRGRLTSIDVSQSGGKLVPAASRDRWTIRHLARKPPSPADIARAMAPAAPIDLAFSVDVDETAAWTVAARRDLLPPRRVVLVDGRSSLGVACDGRH